MSGPNLSPVDPKGEIRRLLREHWSDQEVVEDYAERHGDFEWVIDDHFKPAENPQSIHTGWYNDSNPNPEITVVFDSADPGTATGFDATGPGGSKSAWLDNRAYVDTWVPSDREHTGGIHHATYAWQLCLRAQLIVLLRAQSPPEPWQSLGIGEVRSPDEPDETPIGTRWRIPVLFSDQKST